MRAALASEGVPSVIPDGLGRARRIEPARPGLCGRCDSEPADLLEVLDGWILTVIRCGFLHARGERAHVTRTTAG